MKKFEKLVWDYYRAHGRYDLAWRKTMDPYKILISEVMLQQTQVARVEKFYKKFIKRFPNFSQLAKARTSDVLAAWQGLGYNRRALMLQRLAREVTEKYKGKLPRDREVLESLPGIGRGTSGSLMAFAFNEPVVFIETNIRRAFIHHFFPNRENVHDLEIEPLVALAVVANAARAREWYWALMDYGAMLGEKSRGRAILNTNPNLRSKHYVQQSKFSGSDRELRGKILKFALAKRKILPAFLPKYFKESKARMDKIVGGLLEEGFLKKQGRVLEIR